MLLPTNFKSTIAQHFYDKDVSVLNKTTSSTDGWVDENSTTTKSTFKANVQFNRLGEIQSELGLTEQVDVSMTCADAAVEVGDLVSYDGVTYRVTAAIPFDSHLKVVGRKWA